MLRRYIGLTAALCLWAGTAMAADSNGSFAVKGVGLTKCSQFVDLLKAQDKQALSQYVGWLSGFITASNQHQTDTFDLTPWQNMRTLATLMANYCDKNADLRFVAAAARLVQSLNADRLVDPSELIPIDHEGRKHYVYKEAMRRAQAKLADMGMFTGDVNGEFGDATRTALEAFQKDKELPVNGLPDQRTLLVLFQSTN